MNYEELESMKFPKCPEFLYIYVYVFYIGYKTMGFKTAIKRTYVIFIVQCFKLLFNNFKSFRNYIRRIVRNDEMESKLVEIFLANNYNDII